MFGIERNFNVLQRYNVYLEGKRGAISILLLVVIFVLLLRFDVMNDVVDGLRVNKRCFYFVIYDYFVRFYYLLFYLFIFYYLFTYIITTFLEISLFSFYMFI